MNDSYGIQRELLVLGHKCLNSIQQPISERFLSLLSFVFSTYCMAHCEFNVTLLSWRKIYDEGENNQVEEEQVVCPRCKGSGLIFSSKIGCWLCNGHKSTKGQGCVTSIHAERYNNQKRFFYCYD